MTSKTAAVFHGIKKYFHRTKRNFFPETYYTVELNLEKKVPEASEHA